MFSSANEEPRRKRKGIALSVKLDIIKRLRNGERNKDIAVALNVPPSTICTIYGQREKILKIAKASAAASRDASKVISFTRQPLMEKMENRLLDWIHESPDHPDTSDFFVIRDKALEIYSELKTKALDEGDKSVDKAQFKGSHGWYVRFMLRWQLHKVKTPEKDACVVYYDIDAETSSEETSDIKDYFGK